jgi:hypothetical protein
VVAKKFIFNWGYSHHKKSGKETESEKDKGTQMQKQGERRIVVVW